MQFPHVVGLIIVVFVLFKCSDNSFKPRRTAELEEKHSHCVSENGLMRCYEHIHSHNQGHDSRYAQKPSAPHPHSEGNWRGHHHHRHNHYKPEEPKKDRWIPLEQKYN